MQYSLYCNFQNCMAFYWYFHCLRNCKLIYLISVSDIKHEKETGEVKKERVNSNSVGSGSEDEEEEEEDKYEPELDLEKDLPQGSESN